MFYKTKYLQSIKANYLLGTRKKTGNVFIITQIIFGLFIISVSFLSYNFYIFLIKEDSIIEYLSALFWLFSAITTCIIMFKFRQKYNRYFLCFYLILLSFFIVCCGEEISWGQRILGFKGSSIIIGMNNQGEFNLHDIGHISLFSNAFFFLFVGFFFGYPYIYLTKDTIQKTIIKYNLPIITFQVIQIATITLIIWIIIGIRFGTLGFHPYSFYGYYTQMDDEIFEFLAAYTFWCFTVLDFKVKTKQMAVTWESCSI